MTGQFPIECVFILALWFLYSILLWYRIDSFCCCNFFLLLLAQKMAL